MKIKKKWSIFMAVLMALVTLTMSVAPAMAQDDAVSLSAAEPPYSVRDGLALVVPLGAPVDTPVTMTVLKRSDASPAEGAGVWAFTPENAEILRQRVSAMQESGEISSADVDWDAIVHVYGRFLGRTDEGGKLTATFGEPGRYVLWAVKRGYVPGRSSTVIGGGLKALELRAPNRAQVGERVTMTVLQKGTGNPIAGAGIWALTREQAEAFRQDVEAIREETALASDELDWESIVGIRGTFLGRTGDNGELVTAFNEPGGYLLVAVKWGYIPARHGIYIGEELKVLEIRAPNRAPVNERVSIMVLEKATGNGIESAGVWALTREQAEAFRQDVEAMKADAALASENFDWESIVSIRGTFLGRTGENGELVTAFNETGGYLLVAVKRGYIPARYGIYIYDKPKAMTLRVQQSAEVGDIVPIHISETNTGDPVMGASVWALTREQATAFRQNMASVREQGQNIQDTDWESVVGIHGAFLGRTDERGYLETSFGVPGGYLLVSVKPGYIPGFGFIFIKQPKPELELDSIKIRPEKVQQIQPDNTFTTDNNS
jgi:hypothetical protein